MRIERFDVLKIDIPFRLTFRHAQAERSAAEGVIVRAVTAGGEVGYGECAPRRYVTGEDVESVVACIRGGIARRFLRRDFGSFDAVREQIAACLDGLPRNHHAAFCAVELAVLDLAGHVFEEPVAALAGSDLQEEVRYSGVISADGVEAAKAMCGMMHEFGFRAIKIKVGLSAEDDQAILEHARATVGADVSLRVDANGAWGRDEALQRISSLAGFGLDGVEQPLEAEDVEGFAWLRERSDIPIIIDESLVGMEDAQRFIEHDACDVFNIRISKCGGIINSVRIRDLARAQGVACMLGAQVGESAVLSAAGRHFASRSADLLFLEGSYGRLLLEEDVAVEDLTIGRGGRAGALKGSGLGITIDPERLDRVATAIASLQ